VTAYNRGIGTFESRVAVTAREFKDLGIGDTVKELEPLEPIENSPREIQGKLLGD